MANSRIDVAESYRYCEQLARRSGSNFVVAFRSLPKPMFQEMCALYAFMRRTDDLGDDPGQKEEVRREHLVRWRENLRAALCGQYVPDRVLPALSDVARRRNIPSEYLETVIDGVTSDLDHQGFETFPELERYCYQVAGVVGLCCLRIWGYDGGEPREPALACGTAFQLTNILRDLPEDLRAGRVYLPREDFDRFHCTPEDLAQMANDQRSRDLIKFEVARAWEYYDRALPLRHSLHQTGRRLFLTFLDLYRSLLTEIERSEYDVFSRRISVSSWKKASITLRAIFGLEPLGGSLPKLQPLSADKIPIQDVPPAESNSARSSIPIAAERRAAQM